MRRKRRHEGGGGGKSERVGAWVSIYRTSLPPAHHPPRYADSICNCFSFFLKPEKTLFLFSILRDVKNL
jgi:hypothetical protein